MTKLPLPWNDAALLVSLPGATLPGVLRVLLLLGLVAAPLGLVLLLYRYELALVRRATAAALLLLRLAVVGLVVGLLCLQPIYARDRKVDEPGRVLVFVDQSASMQVRDPQRDVVEKLRLARRFAPGFSAADDECLARWIAELEAGQPPAWLLPKEELEPAAARRLIETERRQLYARAVAAVDELTRGDTARLLLAGRQGLLARVGAKHAVELFGFDRGVRQGNPGDLDAFFAPPAATAGQDGTDIRLALQQAGDRAVGEQGKALAVVLLTDGQHNQGPTPVAEAVALGERKIPVYSFALGSSRSPPALSVLSLRGPDQTVFQGADVDIEVEARVAGQPAGDYLVELARQGADGERTVVDTRVAHHDGKDHLYRDRFKVTLDKPGTQTLTATVRPANAEEGWKPAAKDQRSTTVAVADDLARVLLVDGEARWEYHYLESALKRDRIVKLDRVVFDQPRLNERLTGKEEQTLDLPARQWPEAGLAGRSLVILGDVDPAELTADRRKALEKFVGDGGTLVVVAGKRFMPLAYPETAAGESDPLRRLLPIDQPRALAPEDGFALSLTRPGRETRFMELDAQQQENATLWAGFPRPWNWAVAGRLKPGATPLAAWADPADAALPPEVKERRNVVVARHNYGFGRVLFVGTDGTWRWRYKVGDLYHHRFWGQVVRWAADRPLMVGNEAVRFGTSQPVYRRGAPVEVTARLSDAGLSRTGAGLRAGVRLLRLPDAPGGAEETVKVAPLARSAAGSATLTARVPDLPPGRYALELTIPELGGLQLGEPGRDGKRPPLRAGFSVFAPPSREMIDLQCNESLLRQLAAASDGRVYRPEAADDLETLLSAQTATRIEHHDQPLWQWWVVLVLLVALLSAEWTLRKWGGLP